MNSNATAIAEQLEMSEDKHLSPIISYDLRRIFEVVNCVFICNILGLFGIAANVINMMVFYRQGFQSSMNISFFGLAISDMGSLIALLWFNICVNPLFENSGISMDPAEVQHLTACSPHNCFIRITGWITVFITAERCLCITQPLKIKQMITPMRTTMIICCIYIVMILSYVPEFATVYIDWKFYPDKNKTLLGLAFTSNRKSVEGLVFILYTILGAMSFLAVISFTLVLVLNLKSKSNWRKKSMSDNSQSETLSNRDKRAINMVIIIASVLIICYVPGTAISIVTFIQPEFSITGDYINIFMAIWSFAFVFEASNSSVNIFLYYKHSSKYRQTLGEMFPRCLSQKAGDGIKESSVSNVTYTDTA